MKDPGASTPNRRDLVPPEAMLTDSVKVRLERPMLLGECKRSKFPTAPG